MDYDDDLRMNTIIRALGYHPKHVFAVRLAGSTIEVDVIDFVDNDWPLMTRRHSIPAALLRQSGASCDRASRGVWGSNNSEGLGQPIR